MPTYRHGDMWSAWEEADLFLITANSFIRKDGSLVMGKGIAKQAKDRFPGIDKSLGEVVSQLCGHCGRYYLLISPQWPARKLGLFQVKCEFKEQAIPSLINKSSGALHWWATRHVNRAIHMNYPGIGAGNLKEEQVKLYIDPLPENVHIWRHP